MGFTSSILPWRNSDDNTSEEMPYITGNLKGSQILTPVLTPNKPAITDQINVATTLARATGGSLRVIYLPSVSDQVSMEFRYQVTDDTNRKPLTWIFNQINKSIPNGKRGIRYNRYLMKEVLRAITAHDIDTLILPSDSPGGVLGREATNWLATHANCDVIVVNGQSGYDTVVSLLLPIVGGRHTGVAVDVAHRIAKDCDAWVDILHVVEKDASAHRRERAQECVDAAYQRLALPETTSTWVLEADNTVESIIEQSKYYELTILGAPTKHRLAQFVYGSTNQSIRANAWSVVLSVRNNTNTHSLNQTDRQELRGN